MGAQAMLLGYGASPVTGNYWNPADCSPDITLSGANNQVGTRANVNANQWRTVRSVTSRSAGKRYAEIENTTSFTNGMIAGLADGAMSLAVYAGSTATSWGFHANDAGSGATYNNGVAGPSAPAGTVAQGSYARIAVDFDAGKIWLGTATAWKNSGDPATGATPTFTFTANTVLFLALSEYVVGQVCTLRTGAAEMIGAVPSGFSAWAA